MENVDITLNGKQMQLVPSLSAARAVSSSEGGFVVALQRLAAADMGAMARIIAAGTGKTAAADINAVEEEVYVTGLDSLAAPVVKFVRTLMSGGKTPKD